MESIFLSQLVLTCGSSNCCTTHWSDSLCHNLYVFHGHCQVSCRVRGCFGATHLEVFYLIQGQAHILEHCWPNEMYVCMHSSIGPFHYVFWFKLSIQRGGQMVGDTGQEELWCASEEAGSTLWGSLGRRNLWELDGLPLLRKIATGFGCSRCCCLLMPTNPLLILCSMANLLAFLLSFQAEV